MKSFRVVPHTADVALELAGSNLPRFLEAAAEGLLHLYAPDPFPAPSGAREVELMSDGPEGLLVAWLNELIFLIGTKRWVPSRCRVLNAGEKTMKARLEGAPLGEGKLRLEIKAATFGGLSVRPRRGGGWTAVVILDV